MNKIGITGGTGFIGSRVCDLALQHGHTPVIFTRHPENQKSSRAEIRPIPADSAPNVSGLDAVVHLAGESVFGPWTAAKKQRIFDSRVNGTRRIVEGIAAAPAPPAVLICASAIGFYGDTAGRIVDESSPVGDGLLADTCQAWESEALKAGSLGVRVVCIRIGFVIGKEGAMKIIRPIFSLGLGGNLGSGSQWMSGIHVDDIAGIILWALENENISGPVNAVMPEPFTNAEFTRAVARRLHRPAFLPAPAWALKLFLGELATLLLFSSRVVPSVLEKNSYTYKYRTLPSALEAI